jgi:competence protein ComEC
VWPAALASALLLGGPALNRYGFRRGALLCTVDVGQGDAAALRTGNGRWILFDAGPRFGQHDAGRDVVLPLLRRLGARRIDLFVLSHPDLDHVGGFEAVHDGIRVFRVLDSGHPVPTPAYARFLALIREEGMRWMSGRSGDLYQLDNVSLRVLGPVDSGDPEVAPRANETSLVLRVSIDGALVYLNTGDATTEDERVILSTWGGESLRADVLKVGHHGSRSSTSVPFLEAVHPSLAVISAGRGNTYGHPHAAVLKRLAAASVPRVWRTDRDGTVCIEVDPHKGWRIEGESAWRPARAGGTRLDDQDE